MFNGIDHQGNEDFTNTRMDKIKKTSSMLTRMWGSWYSHVLLGKYFEGKCLVVSQEVKYTLIHDPAIPCLDFYPRKVGKQPRTRMFIAASFTVAPNWKQHTCLWVMNCAIWI